MAVFLITGADRGLGLSLCHALLARGERVYAGQFMPHWPQLNALLAQYPKALKLLPLDVADGASVSAAVLQLEATLSAPLDVVIHNAGVLPGKEGEIDTGFDHQEVLRCFKVNALGAIDLTRRVLPLMAGGMKRLCFVSSEAGSIAAAHRTDTYAYCMSKAALNMGVKLLFNRLRPEGFVFRLYHPGWLRTYMSGEKNADARLEAEDAAEMALSAFLSDRMCEDALVLTDNEGRAWPF